MEYICHTRYKKRGASGREYNIRRGTVLNSIGAYIAKDNAAVCRVDSEDAYMHFSRNDDGLGMRRGELTAAIAYSDRHPNEDNGYRFTEAEIEMLEADYGDFLRKLDVIRFNHKFFNADIDVLCEMARRLEVI